MKNKKKAEEIAIERLKLVSPLLAEGLDAAKAQQLKAAICEQFGLSERTLRRYIAQYQKEGFSGLQPKGRGRPPREDVIPAHILEQAILLRREVPKRSVAQLIQILEWEGRVNPGQIKRSTLQERLAQRGYSSRHMRLYADSSTAARRFQHRHRNQLWHSDIKYGPFLPIGPNGDKRQVYLVVFFDDATRFVLHAEFYPTMDKIIVEDCFRQSIQKYGVPDSVYFDNGKQYKTKWMNRACAKLRIRLLFAKPYSPEATGKVERFNQVVDSFLREVALEKPQTLDELNERFQVWLSECYQNKSHSALTFGISPETAYRNDSKPIRYVEPEEITRAFFHVEERRVDKTGCISFLGKKYEVGLAFIGATVDIVYDPADITELTIEKEGHAPFSVKELVIGERAGKRPKLPEHLQQQDTDHSRLLTAAAKQQKSRKEQVLPAISYRSVKGDSRNV